MSGNDPVQSRADTGELKTIKNNSTVHKRMAWSMHQGLRRYTDRPTHGAWAGGIRVVLMQLTKPKETVFDAQLHMLNTTGGEDDIYLYILYIGT